MAHGGESTRDYDRLEELLGYSFNNRQLLLTALTHRSWANENPSSGRSDNEKLEFLGDAVLDLVVGHALMDAYPHLSEGKLSVTRAQVVSEAGLSAVAMGLGLGAWLFLGRGEERGGGREKPSILADAFEAVVAAVYLDAGFEAARELVSRHLADAVGKVNIANFYDFKTRLQEKSQAVLKETPTYRVIEEHGPDHAKVFVVAVYVRNKELSRAAGKSKKEAEQNAAASAAFLLDGADLDSLEKELAEP